MSDPIGLALLLALVLAVAYAVYHSSVCPSRERWCRICWRGPSTANTLRNRLEDAGMLGDDFDAIAVRLHDCPTCPATMECICSPHQKWRSRPVDIFERVDSRNNTPRRGRKYVIKRERPKYHPRNGGEK